MLNKIITKNILVQPFTILPVRYEIKAYPPNIIKIIESYLFEQDEEAEAERKRKEEEEA